MATDIVIPAVFLDLPCNPYSLGYWELTAYPETVRVTSLIGREQWLMDIYVQGGIPAVAKILDIPVSTLTYRWWKFKKHHWKDLAVEPPFGIRCEYDYEKLLADDYCIHETAYSKGSKCITWKLERFCMASEKRRELKELLEEASKGIELSYEDRAWILFAPRLDLGLLSLVEYAELCDLDQEVSALIIKNLLAYKKPPPEKLVDGRPEWMSQYTLNTAFTDDNDNEPTYKKQLLMRRYRKSQCFKLAYPRYPSRKFHVLWNEPKTHEGETYYPIEALWGAGLEINVKPGRTYRYEGAPGARGGYVTAEYVAKNDFYRWIPEGEYATVKKPTNGR